MLNVASVGAFGPLPGQASYGAAKAFVLSYTQAMREELRNTGVTAAALCPGPVYTGFLEAEGIPDEEGEKALPKFLWQHADAVAKVAVDGMASGKGVIVPGAANRIASVFYHHLPRRLLTPLIARNHPGLKNLGRLADEVDDVTRDDVGLIELQEVPAVLDERDPASVGQHPLNPRRVVLEQPSSVPCR